MGAFGESYVLRVLLATRHPAGDAEAAASRWTSLTATLFDRTGPSSITCAVPARNGEKSTRSMLGVQAILCFDAGPDSRVTGSSAAEGFTADAMGNIFGVEVGPKRVMKHVRQ